MKNQYFKLCFTFCAILAFSIACQKIEYSTLKGQSQNFASNSDLSPLGGGQLVRLRPGEKDFKETFLSDKLDLVLVLDTHQEMNPAYQNNLFGDHFLDKFNDYDWKLAWTDMSVDIKKFSLGEENPKDNKKNSKKSCNFLQLGMAVGGLTSGEPLLLGFGLEGLRNCFSIARSKKKSPSNYANGSFLPFEYQGEKLIAEGFPHLTKETKNHNLIFDHSVKTGTAKPVKRAYEAPELKNLSSYPFLAMAMSMAKGNSPPEDKPKAHPFFRDQSLIVYVLVTVQDLQTSPDSTQFQQNLSAFFGSQNRFKLLTVTLSPETSMFCGLKFQYEDKESTRLKKLTQSLGGLSLDICSSNLGEQLFQEISKSLYTKDFLSD